MYLLYISFLQPLHLSIFRHIIFLCAKLSKFLFILRVLFMNLVSHFLSNNFHYQFLSAIPGFVLSTFVRRMEFVAIKVMPLGLFLIICLYLQSNIKNTNYLGIIIKIRHKIQRNI